MKKPQACILGIQGLQHPEENNGEINGGHPKKQQSTHLYDALGGSMEVTQSHMLKSIKSHRTVHTGEGLSITEESTHNKHEIMVLNTVRITGHDEKVDHSKLQQGDEHQAGQDASVEPEIETNEDFFEEEADVPANLHLNDIKGYQHQRDVGRVCHPVQNGQQRGTGVGQHQVSQHPQW